MILSSWKADTDCCTWECVTCDSTSSYVTDLALSNLCIYGNLSSSEIFKLTSLRSISLAYNKFDASPWPSFGFEQLTDLKYLDLSYSGLSGNVPVEKGKLSNLVTLDLSGLDLKYLSLETLIDNLGSLQQLYLDQVNISVSSAASVPAHFPENSSLEVLRLSCASTWTFPSWIFHIKSLVPLDISWSENLYGELPEFIEGSALNVLILRGTMFSGKIPESIGNLRNLTKLDLSYCQFRGPIPSFAQWPMIYSVDLSSNDLAGSLPSDGYHTLVNLTKLDLSCNRISGAIPASLFSHPSLEYLDLWQNNLTGNFLLYPNISSNLVSIDVSNNKLQGPIPKSLSELVGIRSLDLSSNNFTGTVDLSLLKNCKELDYLSISYNKLSVVEDGNHSYGEYPIIPWLELASCNLSHVPMFLMNQSIAHLDLSNNNIGGHIPDWIWGIRGPSGYSLNLSHNLFTSVDKNLSRRSVIDDAFDLDLHSNKIKGALPLPPLATFGFLDYSDNHFDSSTPEFWSRISYVDYLSLANNSLTGELSHFICNATTMEVLDLSFNNFSGLIPPCLLKDNERLEILNLRGNNFHGSLPQEIRMESVLQIIDLNGNKLEGKLPASIIHCVMLQVLDLGNNLIVDTYPEWLGVLPILKVLVLKSNRFHGPIDYYGMNKQTHSFFPELQVLDLSSNSFNGSLPARFLKQFKAMMVVSSGTPSMYVGIVGTPPALAPNSRPDYKDSVTVTLKGQETFAKKKKKKKRARNNSGTDTFSLHLPRPLQ
ncbi:unnamed protein product [Urochloa humidicola]